MRRIILLGTGLVALIVVAGIWLLVAEGLVFDGQPDYSADWVKCAGEDVCVTVSIPCGWTAVNRRYREDAEAYYSYIATVIDIRCSFDDVPREPPPAYCRAGLCTVE